MRLQEAYRRASRLNREQEASGTSTRYVVVANPIGSCDGDHQVIPRKIRGTSRHTATR